jgi:two-component system KDP operon response regulator KdpE
MPDVLVVDDDELLLRTLRLTLSARGYLVRTAQGAAGGLAEVSSRVPDLAIVDLGLPDADGIDVVTALRATGRTPVIVLSARHTEHAKVAALDAGADDYVTKPFGMDELLARVRAGLRRAGAATETTVVTTASFTVDLAAKQVAGPRGPIRLTPTEWHLLEVLARQPGTLVEHRQLLQEVWGPRYETETNYLRVYVANLRRKLEPDPANPRHLVTEPGIGYRLVP